MAKTFFDLRNDQRRLLTPMSKGRSQEIGLIEQHFPKVYGVGVGHLFGVDGHERHEDVTRAAVWALMHPGHIIHMPKHHVAQFLNLTEQEVEKYWLEAETIMIEGAGNPARDNMMACFQCFGPTVARAFTVFG